MRNNGAKTYANAGSRTYSARPAPTARRSGGVLVELLTGAEVAAYGRFPGPPYLDDALTTRRQQGHPVRDADVARLAPFSFKHLPFQGRFTFNPFTPPGPGQWRPLRDPDATTDEDDE